MDEARADKSAIWEQSRADTRAIAQVAKNIEGNQGVLAQAIAALEEQLAVARQEKDAALDASKSDRRLFERLQKEQAIPRCRDTSQWAWLCKARCAPHTCGL